MRVHPSNVSANLRRERCGASVAPVPIRALSMRTVLYVSPNVPWSIGRMLKSQDTDNVELVVDTTANEMFRQWIESLEDVLGNLRRRESVAWSPASHKAHFQRIQPHLKLLLMAQISGHHLFGLLTRDLLVKHMFSTMKATVYVEHVRYEPETSEWYTGVSEDEKCVWRDKFLDYWRKNVQDGGWQGTDFAEMGVSVCGIPAEDSICCADDDCDACAAFEDAAADRGVYDP